VVEGRPLRIVFCGTPQFAVPALQLLLGQSDISILSVYTQPDRPSGRGQQISYSPVKQVALGAHLPVQQPLKVRLPEVEAHLRDIAPDAIVIIAYGQIIPARLLNIPPLGWINLHASLLPKYRGAAPINWAIVNGETRTGNTTMRIDAGMDTGEMLLQQQLDIGPDETTPELAIRLSEAGAPLMLKTLRDLAGGSLSGRPQDNAAASTAPMLTREDGRIDWNQPAATIYNRMRGFTPWPGAYTTFRGQLCHLTGRPVPNQTTSAAPGTLFTPNPDGSPSATMQPENLAVACGVGNIFRLFSVKLEGRKQVTAAEFASGARINPGERFTSS
jgi:methionyl-tRNA formyltransferase